RRSRGARPRRARDQPGDPAGLGRDHPAAVRRRPGERGADDPRGSGPRPPADRRAGPRQRPGRCPGTRPRVRARRVRGPGRRPAPRPAAATPEAEERRAALDAAHRAETRRTWTARLEAQGAPATARALDLLQKLPGSTVAEALAREGEALSDLVSSDATFASLYSAELLRRSEEHTSELQSRFDLVCR